MKREMINSYRSVQKLSGRAQVRNRSVRYSCDVGNQWRLPRCWLNNLPSLYFRRPRRQVKAFSRQCRATMRRRSKKSLAVRRNLLPRVIQDQDKLDHEVFVEKYQEMHRLGREADGSVTLYIGAENWPFPIPLVAKNGAWRFDPDAGAKEVTFRRIGDNELTAIATCHEFVAAERALSHRFEPR